MFGLDKYDTLFVVTSFLFHISLITLFAIRKWNFDLVVRYGWIFYALSGLALIASILIMRGGKEWSFWIGGFLFLVWAIFGFIVEYQLGIKWRNPIVWPVLIPYVLLYLGIVMFYWWPVGQLNRPLWYLYAAFFALGTYLNITSH